MTRSRGRTALMAGLTAGLVVCVVGLLVGAYLLFSTHRDRSAANLDLSVVQVDESVVPFYELLFDYVARSDAWSIADPYVRRRGKPLLATNRHETIGPHDLLGFRNREIPRRPSIIAIGDSQTYGMNVGIDQTWPSQLERISGQRVYSMALPGWTGLSYLYILRRAVALEPRIVIVALYMGNDSIENTMLAYSPSDVWTEYRSRPELSQEEIPLKIRRGADQQLELPGDRKRLMPFQTGARYDVNDPDSLGVQLGYEIQRRAVVEMIETAALADVKIAFTIIPTKEFLHANWLAAAGTALGEEFERLVIAEAAHQKSLVAAIESRDGVYLDLVTPLAERIERGEELYPFSGDGHPASRGYLAIAEDLWSALSSALPEVADLWFWNQSRPLPGVSAARPVPEREFVEAIERLGYRESPEAFEGFISGIRAQDATPSQPVLHGWVFPVDRPSASSLVALVVDEQVISIGESRGTRGDVLRAFDLADEGEADNKIELRIEGACGSFADSELSAIAIDPDAPGYAYLEKSANFAIECP